MALSTSKCNHLTPLRFLRVKHHCGSLYTLTSLVFRVLFCVCSWGNDDPLWTRCQDTIRQWEPENTVIIHLIWPHHTLVIHHLPFCWPASCKRVQSWLAWLTCIGIASYRAQYGTCPSTFNSNFFQLTSEPRKVDFSARDFRLFHLSVV